ncbi:MAG TPA: exodeoxyribonuclease VII large subunit [Kofleriaceae bacterium]|nr:exodeoxyribonuclease VII large subunit [Kofleriaceae bacterium]
MQSSRDQPLRIADVVRLAGRTLDALGLVWLEGEVSQISQPSSGHLYFALRDRDCVLPIVMWGRDAVRMRFRLEVGQRVRARGRLGVYDRDGKMQLYCDFVEPAGFGAEALALEQLKQKLAAEGMFAAAKKRPLPRFPRRIGVVTSKSGAAIHDIIRTVHRRFPTSILIADAAVQGPLAPAQLVAGMAMVVRAGVDVLIIGRGGGAATDLTAFNHERVVRTISRCPVPVISAVGHETDLSLADLAADARASTPTAAAELCVPDRVALEDMLAKERRRIDREIGHVLGRAALDLDRATDALHARGERAIGRGRAELHVLAHRLAGLHPHAQILRARRDLDALAHRADLAMRADLDASRGELARLGAQLAALSPLAVLDRGYAMAVKGTALIRDPAQVSAGDVLELRLARGKLEVIVKGSA